MQVEQIDITFEVAQFGPHNNIISSWFKIVSCSYWFLKLRDQSRILKHFNTCRYLERKYMYMNVDYLLVRQDYNIKAILNYYVNTNKGNSSYFLLHFSILKFYNENFLPCMQIIHPKLNLFVILNFSLKYYILQSCVAFLPFSMIVTLFSLPLLLVTTSLQLE